MNRAVAITAFADASTHRFIENHFYFCQKLVTDQSEQIEVYGFVVIQWNLDSLTTKSYLFTYSISIHTKMHELCLLILLLRLRLPLLFWRLSSELLLLLLYFFSLLLLITDFVKFQVIIIISNTFFFPSPVSLSASLHSLALASAFAVVSLCVFFCNNNFSNILFYFLFFSFFSHTGIRRYGRLAAAVSSHRFCCRACENVCVCLCGASFVETTLWTVSQNKNITVDCILLYGRHRWHEAC